LGFALARASDRGEDFAYPVVIILSQPLILDDRTPERGEGLRGILKTTLANDAFLMGSIAIAEVLYDETNRILGPG
jgi:hypothetical protein